MVAFMAMTQLRRTCYEALIDYICQMTSINTLSLEYVKPRIGDGELMRITQALTQLGGLVINTADVTLSCIGHVLKEANQITKLAIRISGKNRVNVDELECRVIEELIEARTGLCVRIEVEKRNVDVSG